jgi:hypothetical protein
MAPTPPHRKPCSQPTGFALNLCAQGYASCTANDAGTAVTVGITAPSITVATNIDFDFSYSIE